MHLDLVFVAKIGILEDFAKLKEEFAKTKNRFIKEFCNGMPVVGSREMQNQNLK